MLACCQITPLEHPVISAEWVAAGVAFFGVIATILIAVFTTRAQSTETTIMKRIDLHYQLYDRINSALSTNLSGNKNEPFLFMYQQLKDDYTSITTGILEPLRIQLAYTKFYEVFGHLTGNYFKNLYYLIRYIDEKAKSQKSNHIKLIKAQLSKYELLLLLYNCYWISNANNSKPKGQNFIEYVSTYEILSALESGELISTDKAEHIRFFNTYGVHFDDESKYLN